ncbi:MAG: hypothetical protein IKX60_06915 [Bacteroidales bacterium]|nr:hypothetical protein [Bacteroidales bacterium]
MDKFIRSGAYNDYSLVELKRIRKKLKFAYIFHDIPFKDFWQCRCEELNRKKLRDIVPYKEQKSLWLHINSKAAHDLLCDKWKTYQHFRDFFGREVLFVQDSEKDDMGFRGFISRHSRFIVKPLAMNCGKGIQVLDTSMQDISSYSLLKRYKDGFVAEELIVQDDSLAQFHPASVNTLRIHTVNYGDSLEILWPCLRIGCGGSIVDNAGAGGIFGAVDVDTGRIVAVSDEFHHTFDVHPDTGIHVLGYEIPRWKEACEMAKRLALCMPDCPFVGWDLALTEKGWLMVEGNYGPLLIWQIAVGKGIRKEFNRMKQKIGS